MIEIGKKYVIRNSNHAPNNGKIVTVVSFFGNDVNIKDMKHPRWGIYEGNWYVLDELVVLTDRGSGRLYEPDYLMAECCLFPIDDQSEPGSWEELKDIWVPEGIKVGNTA
jgi:hypothetical protein